MYHQYTRLENGWKEMTTTHYKNLSEENLKELECWYLNHMNNTMLT